MDKPCSPRAGRMMAMSFALPGAKGDDCSGSLMPKVKTRETVDLNHMLMNYTHLRGEHLVYQMIMILKTIIVKFLEISI